MCFMRVKKGETPWARMLFSLEIIFKMLIPPFASLERIEKACRSQLKKNPDAYSPRWLLADFYRFYNKDEAAKRQYLEIQRLGYMVKEDQLKLAEVLFRLGEFGGVIEILEPIIDNYSANRNPNWYLGKSYLETSQFEKAIVFLKRAISDRHPRYEDLWSLGFCHDQAGQLEEAKVAYSKAFALRSDSTELRKNLAWIHVRIGRDLMSTDLRKAEDEFRTALEIDPQNREAFENFEEVCELKEKASS